MSIKFIFIALTYNVRPSIAIVAVFSGSPTRNAKGSNKTRGKEYARKRENKKGKINDKDRIFMVVLGTECN